MLETITAANIFLINENSMGLCEHTVGSFFCYVYADTPVDHMVQGFNLRKCSLLERSEYWGCIDIRNSI